MRELARKQIDHRAHSLRVDGLMDLMTVRGGSAYVKLPNGGGLDKSLDHLRRDSAAGKNLEFGAAMWANRSRWVATPLVRM